MNKFPSREGMVNWDSKEWTTKMIAGSNRKSTMTAFTTA